jgi:hypothetical protein
VLVYAHDRAGRSNNIQGHAYVRIGILVHSYRFARIAVQGYANVHMGILVRSCRWFESHTKVCVWSYKYFCMVVRIYSYFNTLGSYERTKCYVRSYKGIHTFVRVIEYGCTIVCINSLHQTQLFLSRIMFMNEVMI